MYRCSKTLLLTVCLRKSLFRVRIYAKQGLVHGAAQVITVRSNQQYTNVKLTNYSVKPRDLTNGDCFVFYLFLRRCDTSHRTTNCPIAIDMSFIQVNL